MVRHTTGAVRGGNLPAPTIRRDRERLVSLVHPDRLHVFVRRVCAAMGSSEREAGLVADQLIGANLSGHDSHGVGMLPAYVDGFSRKRLQVNQHVTAVVDNGALAVFDGNSGFGQVMGYEATEAAIERAKAHGVAVVGLRNSFHIGRIGHWGEQCARAGLASIHFVNVAGHTPLVAPFAGADARFGTNPFCVAIPGQGDRPAALLDMATSKIAMGKARVALNKGVPVPEDTLLDGEGRVTTDPSGMFRHPRQGALIAMGEHKGSGLAIVCELLGAALLGGLVMGEDSMRRNTIINNMLTIAIDPEAITGRDCLVSEATAYLDYVRASALREGFGEVLMPGEPEHRSRIDRADGVEVDDTTLSELRGAAATVGVPEAAEALD
ncbi:MAG: malate/lactate/ureidoglycolate dehydrogenase [Acidimicrobiales bacterium]|nr:malate/lactate/ureidoglycolate dehydrogenase [Acidimicrobiales bacterium]